MMTDDTERRAGYRHLALLGLGTLWLIVAALSACGARDLPGVESRTEVYSVAAGVNDAEERPGGRVDVSSTDIEMVEDEGLQIVGLRFPNLQIPRGAQLTRAYLQFQVDETSRGPSSLTLHAQMVGDAPAFSRSLHDVSSRVLGAASVRWTPAPWDRVRGAGKDQQSPSLVPLLQTLIDRDDWVPGNAVALIITGSGRRVAEAFDGNAEAAPALHVEYLPTALELRSFGPSERRTETGKAVRFSWSFVSDERDVVTRADAPSPSCQLSIGAYPGDTVTTLYDALDCARLETTHVFSDPGYYSARLSVHDGENTLHAHTDLWVSTPDSAVLVAAGDISCDPGAGPYNGGAGTATSCHMRATSDLVLAQDPDAVAVLGDVQYEDGAYEKFLEAYAPSWGRFKAITYPAVGNHEYIVPGAEGYYRYFGARAGDPDKGYYSYDLGDWHIVVLNSNCTFAGGCGRNSPQAQWLRSDLADNPSSCTLAYWHHPLFSSGEIGGVDWTAPLWDALVEAGAELVLVGHDHHYERFAPQTSDGQLDEARGLLEFVVGGGGKNHTDVLEIVPNSLAQHSGTFGVLRLNLHPTSYDWQFIGESEHAFEDRGNGLCR